jgi:hypothetical protein
MAHSRKGSNSPSNDQGCREKLGNEEEVRSKVEIFFKVVEWPTEIERGGAIYTPPPNTHTIIIVGVSDHQIYQTRVRYV